MGSRTIWLVAAWWWVGPACGHDWSAGTDVAADGEVDAVDADVAADADVAVDADADVAADADGDWDVDAAAADADADADADGDRDADADAAAADADADVPSEVVPAGCGNGVLEPGESCDDGNTATEACGTGGVEACLADCSLRIARCGNGTLDPGEACDDGNDSSYDDCTTSCTVNDYDVGAPCRCISGCSDYDASAGTIAGCERMVGPSGTFARTVCRRSLRGIVLPVELHAAEGSCTWMAVACEGVAMYCSLVPEYGDVDHFSCPPGLVVRTDTGDYLGARLTVKHCAVPCDSERDCRWNSEESADSPWAGSCGQWTCIDPGDGTSPFCEDPRNLD